MASDGSAPLSDVGQMNIKNKVVALCYALMVILLNDGVGANANDAKPNFMHLPQRLHNPRGVGLVHRNPDFVHVPELHNRRGTQESEPIPEDHSNTLQDDSIRARLPHLPQHLHDPRGARLSGPMEEQVDSVPVNQVDSATAEVTQVHFAHLPRLHNPRGVNAVKQIRTAQEGGSQARDEGDNN